MSDPSQGHRLPFTIHYFNWHTFHFFLSIFMVLFRAIGSQSCKTTPTTLLLAPGHPPFSISLAAFPTPVCRWVQIPPLYPASCRRHQKGNPVPLGTTAPSCSWEIYIQGPGPPGWGVLKVKCGRESRRTWTWEWLRWWGPAAIVYDRPILSSKGMLLKDYDCKFSFGKKGYWLCVSRGLLPRRTDWR
jgi:hypothetical protein